MTGKGNQRLKFVYGKIENIVGNGENAGNQHFLQTHNVLNSPSFGGLVKSWDVVVKG